MDAEARVTDGGDGADGRGGRPLRAVTVYCGSSMGAHPGFEALARSVGLLLAGHGITLVYGGGAVGLMGVVADAALSAGGRVVGVIPRAVFRREVAHVGVTELVEVASMHERKLVMFERGDAFVALPGGAGTLEELTEVLTWAQLGLHRKPIATLDLSGYWEPFHAMLRHAVSSGFMPAENLDLVARVTEVDGLLPALMTYEVPYADKWLDVDET